MCVWVCVCEFVSEESAAEWCERNEEILQLLEVQRRANMEDVEFLECQEEMNEQVLEQYTVVERVIGRMVALEYQHVLLSLSLSLPFQLHELVMINHSRSTFASGGGGLPYSECTWEDSSPIADRFLEQIDSFLCRNQAETIPRKSAKVYCERRRGRSG